METAFHSVYQVWFSSGPPDFFTFSYCAWLWNWLILLLLLLLLFFLSEIDRLYDRKRELVATFNREKNEYYAVLNETRTRAKLKRREMAAAKKAEDKPVLSPLVKTYVQYTSYFFD